MTRKQKNNPLTTYYYDDSSLAIILPYSAGAGGHQNLQERKTFKLSEE